MSSVKNPNGTKAVDKADSSKGMFIVFEGIDGAGKSTAAKMLCDVLRDEGMAIVLTSEPSDSWLGEVVKKGNKENISPISETLLYVADRADHTRKIKGWLLEGRTVICDRYVGSTYAYQSNTLYPVLGPRTMEWLTELNEPLTIQPSITFLLRIDPSIAMIRLRERHDLEKFEKLEFLQKVDSAYAILAEKDPSYIVMDASRPILQILEEMVTVVHKKL